MGSSVDKKQPPEAGGGECGGFYTPPEASSTLSGVFLARKFKWIHER
jgi:hypothetical protein